MQLNIYNTWMVYGVHHHTRQPYSRFSRFSTFYHRPLTVVRSKHFIPGRKNLRRKTSTARAWARSTWFWENGRELCWVFKWFSWTNRHLFNEDLVAVYWVWGYIYLPNISLESDCLEKKCANFLFFSGGLVSSGHCDLPTWNSASHNQWEWFASQLLGANPIP